MKIFFSLLLLSNIAFALVQWLFPYEQMLASAKPLQTAEKLQLISELDTPRAEPQASVITVSKPSQLEVAQPEEVIPVQLCYTLGPFKEQQSAQQVAQAFRKSNLTIKSRASQEKEYMGQMVYIDGHKSREEAIKTAETLGKKGIRDYIIVNKGEHSNILSLGVFSLKVNADRRQKTIARLGYPVKSEARYRDRTIYWLDYNDTESESLSQIIDDLKQQQGISKISRQCG